VLITVLDVPDESLHSTRNSSLQLKGIPRMVPVFTCALVVVREDELVFQPCRCEAFSFVRSGRARRVGMLVCCYALRSNILEIHLFGEVPGGVSF